MQGTLLSRRATRLKKAQSASFAGTNPGYGCFGLSRVLSSAFGSRLANSAARSNRVRTYWKHELGYWLEKFGVSRQEGPMVKGFEPLTAPALRPSPQGPRSAAPLAERDASADVWYRAVLAHVSRSLESGRREIGG